MNGEYALILPLLFSPPLPLFAQSLYSNLFVLYSLSLGGNTDVKAVEDVRAGRRQQDPGPRFRLLGCLPRRGWHRRPRLQGE